MICTSRKTTSYSPPRQGEQGFPGVKEPGMLYHDIMATWETLLILPKIREYDKQPIQREDIKYSVGSRIAL
jgi:hypothetical protein